MYVLASFRSLSVINFTDCSRQRFLVVIFYMSNLMWKTPLFVSTFPYILQSCICERVDCIWKVMARAQKPDFVFRRNGRIHLNRRGRQFSRLLAAEVCASAVIMLDTPCSEVVWRVLATHSIRQFPLHVPSRASPCAITFHLDSTTLN